MACFEGEYFIGNGSLYLRTKESGCDGSYTGGYIAVGDVEEMTISVDHDTAEHYESVTGNRTKALMVPTSTSVDFEAMLKSFSLENLVKGYWGYQNSAVAAGSVVGEVVSVPGGTSAGMYTLAYPEVSNVVIVASDGSPGTPLVLDTDYTVDARNGTFTIIEGAPNLGAATEVEVNYDHGGIAGSVESFITNSPEFGVRFEAVNLAQPDKPWIVEIWRLKLQASETLSLIGTETNDITLRGSILPNANTGNTSAFFKVTQGNTQ